MTVVNLQAPPETGNKQFDAAIRDMWRKLTGQILILWATIDKSGASLSDLPQRLHSELTDVITNRTHPQIDVLLGGLGTDVTTVTDAQATHTAANSVHGVGATSVVVGTATNQALTNKLITLQSALKQLTTDTQTANAGSATQTSADLTDSTGGVVGLTIVDVTAAHDQAVLNANFASITDQVKKLVVEIGLLITYVNSIQTTTNDTLTKLRKTTGCGILDG